MKYKYILVKSIYCEDPAFIRYGIAAVDVSEYPHTVIRTAADLTGDIISARSLAEKCNTINLPPYDLDIAIDEFLSASKI